MATTGTPWTDERVERLKSMWMDGRSASEIARELGGVSRNAVIGKVHRLGLSGRQGSRSKPAAAAKPGRKAAARAQKPAVPARRPSHRNSGPALALRADPEPFVENVAVTGEVIPMTRNLTLLELGPRTCRWPIGDPQSPDFRFCGAPTESGQVYCSACSKKAYETRAERSRNPAANRGTRRLARFG
jgi:GcrA cell cycle regulator